MNKILLIIAFFISFQSTGQENFEAKLNDYAKSWAGSISLMDSAALPNVIQTNYRLILKSFKDISDVYVMTEYVELKDSVLTIAVTYREELITRMHNDSINEANRIKSTDGDYAVSLLIGGGGTLVIDLRTKKSKYFRGQ